MTATLALPQPTVTTREEKLASLRFTCVVMLVALNAADLLLTRHILTLNLGHEANALLAPIILGGWGVALKIGIPAIVGWRHLVGPLRPKLVAGLVTVTTLYIGVVLWNAHLLWIRS